MPTQSAPARVRFRKIEDADLQAVAGLLSEGFLLRPKGYWLRGLRRHAERPRPANYPTYGYMIESGGVPVGAILMLFSEVETGQGKAVRCNLSSWYVKPEFRNYSSLLVTSAIKDKSVTYFNVSPAPNTWPTVEAQGFSMYCRGQMYALPALSAPDGDARIVEFDGDGAHATLPEADLLRQHQALGCLCVVVQRGNEKHPLVFQRDRVLKRLLPAYRLVYGEQSQFVRFAGNLGRHLLVRKAIPLIVVSADKPIEGLVGRYTEKQGRKYAKGPHTPGLADLAFTEFVFFNG